MKRAIEDSFLIVEINRLAVPERNAFKPIYQMHKWFARRASCVFRAILLGALKPLPIDDKGNPTKSGAQLIMDEFYRDHTDDPDTKGKVILDPFMGGGTTVVEALRLGCKVIGVDLNPVAWFIVKTEVEPVDIDELKAAFERVAIRRVEWSRKTVRESLLEQYKTECPCCENKDADIIYNFWVKSAICHNRLCPARSGEHGVQVPLFSDYIVAYKKPSIRYWPDVSCPKCGKTFDWEIEPATLVADPKLMLEDARTSAGEGRGNVRWACGPTKSVCCPWCKEEVKPLPKSTRLTKKGPRPERKKIPLTALLCPHCESVWQWRGDLADHVICPACRKGFDPANGNVPERGKFVCPSCGTKQSIIESIRQLPKTQLLPLKAYAIQGYCSCCGSEDPQIASDLLGTAESPELLVKSPQHPCRISNSGKFFKRVHPRDLGSYNTSVETWEREKSQLPFPKQEIPPGEKTDALLGHHYRYWHQMFTPRQLLCLATLLDSINQEPDQTVKEMLLTALQGSLEANNIFARYRIDSGGRSPFGGIFARHDFHPKNSPCEINVWGPYPYYGTFTACFGKVLAGKRFAATPSDTRVLNNKRFSLTTGETVMKDGSKPMLYAQSSTDLSFLGTVDVDHLVTDPPYADNVNYAELADFFYVWLRLALCDTYPLFAPELVPKSAEIIQNPARKKTAQDFEDGLRQAFGESAEILSCDGLLVFTFHHAEGTAWEALLRALCDAGFEVHSVYPIHGESESSMHLMEKEGAISYDLVHVCRKRDPNAPVSQRSWAGIRQAIRQHARDEIRAIESGRYGNEPLSPADVNIVLIGKCLELYSKHYRKIVDHEGNPMPLHVALEEIRMLVDQLTSAEQELPSELENIDPLSYVYLTSLCGRSEVKSDEVHKATRGILEPDELLDTGLIIKGRAKRGRTYEVKSAIDRLPALRKKFGASNAKPQPELFEQDLSASARPGVLFIDYVHFLLGLAETGESVIDWLETFRGRRAEIRAALEYMARKNKVFAEPAQRIIGLMDERTLFTKKD
jgi:putative DNA methylase